MTELAFTKKPRRMTRPSQNQSEWLVSYEGVQVIMETDLARMAYFAREATWGDILREPTQEEMDDTLREVAEGKVLGAAYKGGIGFRITASRSTMDQMLRLAEGSGGAGSGAGAQTTRDNDHRYFNIVVPNTIEDLVNSNLASSIEEQSDRYLLYHRVEELMREQRAVYGALVDAGVPPQDARYVALPLGFQTQWFHVMSLGNMIKMCEQRLCNGLTQHETNYLVRIMRDLVVAQHPWMDKNLRSGCEKRGQCAESTMLFPPCGAFVEGTVQAAERSAARCNEPWEERNASIVRDRARLTITTHNPDKHLYSVSQNAAMQFAVWDIQRQTLEREHPNQVFCMSGPPETLNSRVASGGGVRCATS